MYLESNQDRKKLCPISLQIIVFNEWKIYLTTIKKEKAQADFYVEAATSLVFNLKNTAKTFRSVMGIQGESRHQKLNNSMRSTRRST